MFSSDGFFNDKSSNKGSSQTHIFTSFPNSAVDPDDDHSQSSENPSTYGYNPSNNIEQTTLPLPVTANSNESKTEQTHVWQIEYYQKYFQIDTEQVLQRLIGSIIPRPNQSYFNSTIRPNPDLYGPFWVCVTFIVIVAISGNIVTYFHSPNTDFQIDFSKITLSAILIFLYWWLMPTVIYLYFRWHIKRIEYTFIELLCIYGYSLTIFIPISILWMIPIPWLQWLLTIISSLISGSVLIVTFWPTVYSEHKPLNALSMLIILLAHLLMAICIMLVFFHISDENIHNKQYETTSRTSTILSTKKQI